MLGGHTAAEAEAWAAQCTSWGMTTDHAINVFASACARLYDEIARDDPQPWKKGFAAVAQDWAEYPLGEAQRAPGDSDSVTG
jgi:hypothetical protein